MPNRTTTPTGDDTGACADLDRFQPVIETLPGASILAERWRDSPRCVVLVDADGTIAEDLHGAGMFDAARAAFVHRDLPDPRVTRWVAVAPQIAAQTLQFCADDHVTVEVAVLGDGPGSPDFLPALSELDDHDVCELVARCARDDHLSYEDAFATADDLAGLAGQLGLPWRAVIEFVDNTATVDLDGLEAVLAASFDAAAA